MDFNFLKDINSIYALLGALGIIFIQMYFKYKEEKKYREERNKNDLDSRLSQEKMHLENLESNSKNIERLTAILNSQQELLKSNKEMIDVTNDKLDLNTELIKQLILHILEMALDMDKKNETNKTIKYSQDYLNIQNRIEKKNGNHESKNDK